MPGAADRPASPPPGSDWRIRLGFVLALLKGRWPAIVLGRLVPIALLEAGVVVATREVLVLTAGAAGGHAALADLALAGAAILGFLALRGVLVTALWHRLLSEVATAQAAVATRLFAIYLARPWRDLVADERSRMLETLRLATHGLLHNLLRPLLTGLTEALVALAIVVALAVIAPLPTLLLLAWMACVFGGIGLMTLRTARKGADERWKALHRLRVLADHAFREIRSVRLAGAEPAFLDRQREGAQRFAMSLVRETTVAGLPRLVTELALIVAVLLILGGLQATGTPPATTARLLVVFAVAALRLMPAAQRFVAVAQQLQNAAPDLSALIADLALPVEPLGPVEDKRAPALGTGLELAGIAFAYRPGSWIIPPGTHLALARGERLQIAGPSGIGKSTLLSLALGFVAPDRGEVRIDGHPGAALDRLRGRAVALVPQEPCLITGTIAENLAFPGDPAALDRARSAALLAELDIPFALDAPVGDEGLGLSGGQRQRLALARAILQAPDLLVLDEAMSQLDPASEARAWAAIARHLPGATLMVIAHRALDGVRIDRRWRWDGGAWRDERAGNPPG